MPPLPQYCGRFASSGSLVIIDGDASRFVAGEWVRRHAA
jgi:hypothetical protein